MSLESYYATVNGMVSSGSFEHIGHASIRVEGSSAWGVWLRVDHWPTALGRHPRLRCGVLYHVANRTLSFHGDARDAFQFLLPLFESWTFTSSLNCHQLAVRVLQFLRWTTLMHPRPLLTPPCLPQATSHLFVALSASWLTSAMATKEKSEVCVKKFPSSAPTFVTGRFAPSSSCSFTTSCHTTCRQPTCHINGSSSTFCCRSSPTSSAILCSLPTFWVLCCCGSLVSCGILSGPLHQSPVCNSFHCFSPLRMPCSGMHFPCSPFLLEWFL